MAERDWIQRYFAPLVRSSGAAALADDAALLAPSGRPVLITTDAMAEGIHFFPDDPPASLARKLVRVNVSDILAGGAEPAEALLVLGWPEERPEAQIADFAAALGQELAAWGAGLIGGDTLSSPSGLFLSLTLTGHCLGPAPVRRAGARPGDTLWVTGEIGAACRGYLWKTTGQGAPHWLAGLREPVLPPLEAARLIADHASAAMDVSDGLLGDAAQLAAASGVALEIDLGRVAYAGGAADADEAVALASFGDDYQLLFAAPPDRAQAISDLSARAGFAVSEIGRITPGNGLSARYDGSPVNLPETIAFEHGRIGTPATRR